MPDPCALSIIVPVLDDGPALARLLAALAPWRRAGDEVIVVDGGSSDDSVAIARAGSDRVVLAARGRALQMNAGAQHARGTRLWFVHADSDIAGVARESIRACSQWGFFDICVDDPAWPFRVIEWCMNRRARMTRIATGDQGLFVTRKLFERAGGFPALPLMEDVAISRRLRALARPCRPRGRLLTSARRWRRHGIVRTVVLMWSLRLAWFCGAPAAWLARIYGYR